MAEKGNARIYVPINKTGRVTQVDVSDLKVEENFGLVPPKKKNGRVVGHLDQTLTTDEILANFRALCMILAAAE
jgi:hypothetical protein